MPDDSIKTGALSNSIIPVALGHINAKLQVQFDSHCLKQDKVTFSHKQVDNIWLSLFKTR